MHGREGLGRADRASRGMVRVLNVVHGRKIYRWLTTRSSRLLSPIMAFGDSGIVDPLTLEGWQVSNNLFPFFLIAAALVTMAHFANSLISPFQ